MRIVDIEPILHWLMAFTREIVVDLWRTGAHGVELGIKKYTEHRAKSRQFTKDMDIIGEVKEGDKELGYVCYREDPWKEDVPLKKLVIKYFTKSMNWKGSFEELLSRGIAQSISADMGLPSFIINLSSEEYLFPVERVQKHGSFNKAIYAVLLIDDKNNQGIPYSIEEDRFTLGSDWDVYDVRRKKIARIDGSAFNFGGKYKIMIDEEAPTYHRRLAEILILFSTSLRFIDDVEKKLKETAKKLRKSGEPLQLDSDEVQLFLNPRRVAV